MRTKVNFGRYYAGQFHRCGVKMVALIRQIGQPAVTGNFVIHRLVSFGDSALILN
jgi:hypothetical protein